MSAPGLSDPCTADPAMERAALADSALHRAARADPASRDTSAMEPQVEDPEEGPGEVAVDRSRVNDSPTRAADSVETPLFTPWTLPVDATSTGVDSEVSPLAMMEQMAWDASVMLISTETNTCDAHSHGCRDNRAISMAFLDGGWHRYTGKVGDT